MKAGRLTFAEQEVLGYTYKLPPNHFDGVASAFTIHNFPRSYRRALETDIFRILRPGGLFVNADKYAHDDEGEHMTAFSDEIELLGRAADHVGRPDIFEAWANHYLEDEHPGVIMFEQDEISLLKYKGFAPVIKIYRQLMEAILTAKKPHKNP